MLLRCCERRRTLTPNGALSDTPRPYPVASAQHVLGSPESLVSRPSPSRLNPEVHRQPIPLPAAAKGFDPRAPSTGFYERYALACAVCNGKICIIIPSKRAGSSEFACHKRTLRQALAERLYGLEVRSLSRDKVQVWRELMDCSHRL